MACYAKVNITGKLVREPKQNTVNGTTVINFGVSVYTTKKDGDRYLADIYNVNYWGKAAENVLPRLKKNCLVQVYGDLQLDEYTTKNGDKDKSMSIRANEVIAIESIFRLVSKDGAKADNDEDDNPPF